jgi:hypothetical protein
MESNENLISINQTLKENNLQLNIAFKEKDEIILDLQNQIKSFKQAEEDLLKHTKNILIKTHQTNETINMSNKENQKLERTNRHLKNYINHQDKNKNDLFRGLVIISIISLVTWVINVYKSYSNNFGINSIY